jgi:hypothetical protein
LLTINEIKARSEYNGPTCHDNFIAMIQLAKLGLAVRPLPHFEVTEKTHDCDVGAGRRGGAMARRAAATVQFSAKTESWRN